MRLAIDGRVLTHEPTGVARYLRGLLGEFPALRRPGDRLEIIVDRPPDAELPGAPDAVSVARWPLPGGDPAWRQLRLAAALAGGRADVLFCPFYSAPLACRTPTVVTIHDVSFRAHPEWFTARARLAFGLSGPSARRAQRVIADSEFTAAEIERHLAVPRARIEVVLLGLEAGWLAPVSAEARARARAWLGLDGPYLLHFGAVHARRNPGLLLEAYAQVARERPELALVVAGPSLDATAEAALRRRAGEFAGRLLRREWVPEEHVRGLLSEARALVYLSSYEGFGLPALEAAASGVPVVALRRASLPEVLGEAALWVEETDPGAVAAAIRRLDSEPGLAAALGEAGRSRAAGFGWRRAAERTFGILREVAAGRPAPRSV